MKYILVLLVLVFPLHIVSSQEGNEFWGTHLLNFDKITGSDKISVLENELERFDFGYLRLWDIKAAWSSLEPAEGEYQWDNLDRYINLCQNTGLKPVMTLALTPQWASSKPHEPCAYDDGNAAPPKDMETWVNFVSKIGRRYNSVITDWEIWNEPNNAFSTFYSGSKEDLARLIISAGLKLKEINPENRVIAPALIVEPGSNIWLSEFFETAQRIASDEYNTGLDRVIDVVSFHFYAPYPPLLFLKSECKTIRRIMNNHGLSDKQLWLTEAGVDTGWIKNSKRWPKMLETMTETAAGNGVDKIFYYAWTSKNMVFTPFADFSALTEGRVELTPFGTKYLEMRNLD